MSLAPDRRGPQGTGASSRLAFMHCPSGAGVDCRGKFVIPAAQGAWEEPRIRPTPEATPPPRLSGCLTGILENNTSAGVTRGHRRQKQKRAPVLGRSHLSSYRAVCVANAMDSHSRSKTKSPPPTGSSSQPHSPFKATFIAAGSSRAGSPLTTSANKDKDPADNGHSNNANTMSNAAGANNSGGLFGWVKTAFSAPLVSNRSVGSSSPRSGTPKQSDHRPLSRVGSKGRELLPSRNLEEEFAKRRESSASSSQDNSSLDRYSITETEEGSDDEDEEIYAPFEPAQLDQNPQPAAISSQPQTSVVRPTARRSLSLDYGDKEELDAEVARLELQDRSTQANANLPPSSLNSSSHQGLVVTDEYAHTPRSPPSLTLTVPDGNTSEKLTSPLVAGWASPEQGASPLSPDGITSWNASEPAQIGDGESIQAATGQLPRSSRETVALGSRSVAMRSFGEQQPSVEVPSVFSGPYEDWDESRAKTPKVLADVVAAQKAETARRQTMERQTSADARTPTTEYPPVLPSSALPDSATPTPRPEQGNRQFSGHHQRSASEANAGNILKAPTPIAPVRRRLFSGVRRRLDSGEQSADDYNEDAAGSDGGSQSGARRNRAASNSSAASFWWRTRKASAASERPGSSHQQMSTSSSFASGMSIEVPLSDGASSSNPNSRPASIAASDSRSLGASSWGKTKRVKLKSAALSLGGGVGPRKVKSRAKNKPSGEKTFGQLFLAQELYLGLPSPSEELLIQKQEDRRNSSSSEFGVMGEGNDAERPRLTTASSQSSMASSASISSSAMGFSTASHSTVGSYGAHGKKKATWAVKFSLDGRYLAIAGQDAVVRVFQVLDQPEQRHKEVYEAQRAAEMLAAAEKAAMSASRDSFGSTKMRGSSAGTSDKKDDGSPPLKPIPVFSSKPIREFRGHSSDVLSLDWSKGNFLLSSSMDKTVKIWHLSKPECLITFGHGDFVTSAIFHPRDDRFFLSGSLDGKLRLWNIASKKVQASADVPGLITAAAFSASGTTAIAGTFSGALLFYRTEDLSYQSSIAVRSSSGKNTRGRKITGIEAVSSVTPAPVGRSGTNGVAPNGGGIAPARIEERILISSNDSRVRVYSLTDKRLTAKYRASTYLNRTSQIRASSADDTYVVAGSESGEVYVWDSARDAVGLAAFGKKATKGGSKVGGGSGVTGSEICEYWTAADNARPVTVAVIAPLKTHSYLTRSEDPVEMHSAMTNQSRVASSGPTALSAMGLANALSAAMPTPLKPGSTAAGAGMATSPPPGWDPRENRIVISVDESQIVRVWRSVRDSHVIGAA